MCSCYFFFFFLNDRTKRTILVQVTHLKILQYFITFYYRNHTPKPKQIKPKKKPLPRTCNLSPLRNTLSLISRRHRTRSTPRLLHSLLRSKRQHLNLRRKPLPQRLRMKCPPRRKPRRERRLDHLILQNLPRRRLVLHAKIIQRRVFLR